MNYTYAPVNLQNEAIPHLWLFVLPTEIRSGWGNGGYAINGTKDNHLAMVTLPDGWRVYRVDCKPNGNHVNPFTLRMFTTWTPNGLSGEQLTPAGDWLKIDYNDCNCGYPDCGRCCWVPNWEDESPVGSIALPNDHKFAMFVKSPRGTGRSESVVLVDV